MSNMKGMCTLSKGHTASICPWHPAAGKNNLGAKVKGSSREPLLI